MKSIKLIMQDCSGLVADITQLLADHKINIKEIEATTFDQQAVVEMIVDHPNSAMRVLRARGLQAVANTLITIRIVDEPGALAKVTRELSEAKIAIRGISTLHRSEGYCFVALSTDHDAVAKKLLHAVLV